MEISNGIITKAIKFIRGASLCACSMGFPEAVARGGPSLFNFFVLLYERPTQALRRRLLPYQVRRVSAPSLCTHEEQPLGAPQAPLGGGTFSFSSNGPALGRRNSCPIVAKRSGEGSAIGPIVRAQVGPVQLARVVGCRFDGLRIFQRGKGSHNRKDVFNR